MPAPGTLRQPTTAVCGSSPRPPRSGARRQHARRSGPLEEAAKMLSKFAGVYPVTRLFRAPRREALYTTLLMSTGLTFGSIASLFGLSHGIMTQQQYSYLIAAVIGSAIVPTLIANGFFLPRHLL